MWPPLTIGVVFTKNTNLLQIHFPKVKPPHIATPKSHVHFYYILSIYPLLENLPDLNIFPLILAENTLFSPDFPDWKKFSKFSLISLIGGNPDLLPLLIPTLPPPPQPQGIWEQRYLSPPIEGTWDQR